MNNRSIFWFRRDLRVEDNTGLYHAVRDSKEAIPIFIFDDNIIKRLLPENLWIGFLLDAIENLDTKLMALGSYLLILKGRPEEIITK